MSSSKLSSISSTFATSDVNSIPFKCCTVRPELPIALQQLAQWDTAACLSHQSAALDTNSSMDAHLARRYSWLPAKPPHSTACTPPHTVTLLHCYTCRFTVDAGGVTWAYRKSEPAEAKADPAKPPVLLLHGLGSSSYSYR
jgi:hypothetical protein